MTTTYFLIKIANQIFAVERSAVAGVIINSKVKEFVENGVSLLPVSGGRKAVVVDLAQTLPIDPKRRRGGSYCVLKIDDHFIALPMRGKGRVITASNRALLPLPNIFGRATSELVSGVLANEKLTVPVLRQQALLKEAS